MSNDLMLRYSKDGGHNFSDRRQLDIGETGDFNKSVVTRRLGMGREYVFEISYSGPRRCDVLAMSIQAEGEG